MSELQDTADHLVVVGRGPGHRRHAASASCSPPRPATGSRCAPPRPVGGDDDAGRRRRHRGRHRPRHAHACRGWRPSSSWRCSAGTGCRSRRCPRTGRRWRRRTWNSPGTRSSSAAGPSAEVRHDGPATSGADRRAHLAGRARTGFAQLLRAEWTKFRTVRGWVIGLVVAALVTCSGSGLLIAVRARPPRLRGPTRTAAACPAAVPVGPGGEAGDRPVLPRAPAADRDGSITVRVTSLTGRIPSANGNPPLNPNASPDTRAGLVPWAKAGVIVKESTRPGSAVRGDHGHRRPRGADAVQLHRRHRRAAGRRVAATPHWLRLTRSGDTLTGYDSADGTHWTQVGTAQLAGLPSTVQVGLFAASPLYRSISLELRRRHHREYRPSQATASSTTSACRPVARRDLARRHVGRRRRLGRSGGCRARQAGQFTVTGSGDIAPVSGTERRPVRPSRRPLVGHRSPG